MCKFWGTMYLMWYYWMVLLMVIWSWYIECNHKWYIVDKFEVYILWLEVAKSAHTDSPPFSNPTRDTETVNLGFNYKKSEKKIILSCLNNIKMFSCEHTMILKHMTLKLFNTLYLWRRMLIHIDRSWERFIQCWNP